MSDLLQALLADRDRVVILDGGMGTMVEDRGVPTTSWLWGSTALMTARGRAINDAIHREFVAAGAEVLIANTHNTTLECCRQFLAEHGRDTDTPADRDLHCLLLEHAFASARRAVPEPATVAVAGCISNPEGAYAASSEMSPGDAQAFYEWELRARSKHEPDLVILETMSTRAELLGAAAACASAEGVAVAFGLTCREDGRTCFGVDMREAVEILLPARPCIWFVQCTRYDIVDAALAELSAAVPDGAVLGVYANDGRIWRGRRWHGERLSVETYLAAAKRWRDRGARVIGGCCGTTPDHIAALAREFHC